MAAQRRIRVELHAHGLLLLSFQVVRCQHQRPSLRHLRIVKFTSQQNTLLGHLTSTRSHSFFCSLPGQHGSFFLFHFLVSFRSRFPLLFQSDCHLVSVAKFAKFHFAIFFIHFVQFLKFSVVTSARNVLRRLNNQRIL